MRKILWRKGHALGRVGNLVCLFFGMAFKCRKNKHETNLIVTNMTKAHALLNLILIVAIAVLFAGCDHVLDCIDGSRPELLEKDLAVARVAVTYRESVGYWVSNAPTENYSITNFSIKGDLPPGVESYLGVGGVVFEGVPTAIGTYVFTVRITMGPFDGERDALCGDTASREYKIVVDYP